MADITKFQSANNVSLKPVNAFTVGVEDVDTSPIPPDVPPQVEDLQVMEAQEALALSWASVTANPPVTSFIVNYRIFGETLWESVNVGNVPNYTVTGLDRAVLYEVRVRAVNNEGAGPFSDVVTGTPTGVPYAPVSFALSPSDGEVQASWQEPNSHPPITGYRLEYKLTSGSTWIEVNLGVILTHTVTGLTNGESYDFRVAAINSVGLGDYSETLQAIPMTSQGTKLIEWNDLGIVQSSGQISAINNTAGSSAYNADLVFGSASSLQRNFQNGLPHPQANSGVGLRLSAGINPIALPFTLIWFGRVFQLDNNRYRLSGTNSSLRQTQTQLTWSSSTPIVMPLPQDYTTAFVSLRADENSAILRYTYLDGTFQDQVLNSQIDPLALESLFWDVAQTNNASYVGTMYEVGVWDSKFLDSTLVSEMADMALKWGFNFTTDDFSSADFSSADFSTN